MKQPFVKRVKPILEIKDLSIVFGPHPTRILPLIQQGFSKEVVALKTGNVVAVQSISLSIFPGEIFVLMGLSGSGKSTLLRAINGLITPTTGEILLEHESQILNLALLKESQLRLLRKKRFSMVFQHFGLMPWRTVADNVALGIEGLKISREKKNQKIAEILSLVGLEAWALKYPHELSGGMQQRVGLARALITDADILLMDEPFSALDPIIRCELQKMLIDLQKQFQKTIIFVGHDFDEAIQLGNRLAVMKDGKIVNLGTPYELIQGEDRGESVTTIEIDDEPLAVTNREGQYLGVIGGSEIFQRILSSSHSHKNKEEHL